MTEPLPAAAPRVALRDPRPWMQTFLDELAASGLVRRAARAAGIANTTAYDARRIRPDFAAAWQRMVDDATGDCEDAGAIAAASEPEHPPESSPGSLPESPEKASPHWRMRFFEALAETSSVTAAAVRAKIPVRTAYKLRREDAEFAARWRAALLEGYDNLEMELLGFLRSPRPGRRMDVTAALRLLAAHRETVARERALREDDDEQEVLDSIDAFLEDMRQRRLANSAILLEAEAGDDTD